MQCLSTEMRARQTALAAVSLSGPCNRPPAHTQADVL